MPNLDHPEEEDDELIASAQEALEIELDEEDWQVQLKNGGIDPHGQS